MTTTGRYRAHAHSRRRRVAKMMMMRAVIDSSSAANRVELVRAAFEHDETRIESQSDQARTLLPLLNHAPSPLRLRICTLCTPSCLTRCVRTDHIRSIRRTHERADDAATHVQRRDRTNRAKENQQQRREKTRRTRKKTTGLIEQERSSHPSRLVLMSRLAARIAVAGTIHR